MKTYPAESLPAAWTDSGALVTIHGDDGPLITGWIDAVWHEHGHTKVALVVGTIDGHQIRTIATVPNGARFERTQA